MCNNFEKEKIYALKWETIKKFRKDTSNNDADIDNSEISYDAGTKRDIIILRDKNMKILAHYIESVNGFISRLDND